MKEKDANDEDGKNVSQCGMQCGMGSSWLVREVGVSTHDEWDQVHFSQMYLHLIDVLK